jgi:hypothetical protein
MDSGLKPNSGRVFNGLRYNVTSSSEETSPMQSKKASSPRKGFSLPQVNSGLLNIVLLLIVVVQSGALIYFMFFPPFLAETRKNDALVKTVASKATVSQTEAPQIATVTDADKLRSSSPIAADIYKDVKSGDKILAYSDKIIVYRESESKVVYDGLSPGQKVQEVQQELAVKIRAKAVETNILPKGNTESPQLSIVSDAAEMQKSSKFYAKTVKDDIVAIFPQAEIIILYRPSDGTIINSGRVRTSIDKI